MIALKGLVKARCNIGDLKEEWKLLQHVQRLNTDLAEPENDLYNDIAFKVKIGN